MKKRYYIRPEWLNSLPLLSKIASGNFAFHYIDIQDDKYVIMSQDVRIGGGVDPHYNLSFESMNTIMKDFSEDYPHDCRINLNVTVLSDEDYEYSFQIQGCRELTVEEKAELGKLLLLHSQEAELNAKKAEKFKIDEAKKVLAKAGLLPADLA